ncbi:MAG: hypothetical protein RLZ98_1632 [Pseudomonadota bacterium]|jgi:tripartite-type tricarboxylate transporter receptor subunit TctC
MQQVFKSKLAMAAGLATSLAAAPVMAEDFYKGKTISIIITSGTGGSVDLYGRLGARYLSKHLPGNPSVIAQNKGGAGGLVGANYVYDQAPKDGTVLGSSLNSIPFAPLFYGKKTKATFDPVKFNWIASPAPFIAVALAWHTSKIKKWQDLREHQMIVGSAGRGSTSTVDGLVMNALMGFKYKVIFGYPGGGDIDLAMIRGETEGRATTAWAGVTSRNPQWLKDKQVTILYQMGLEKYHSVPAEVPLIIDHVEDPKKKAALKLKMAAYDIGYPVYAPPGVPGERVALLRKAYAAAYADPGLLADAKRAGVDFAPMTGEKVEALLREVYAAPDDIKEMLQRAIDSDSGSLDEVKTSKATSTIKGFQKKGRTIVFDAGGKQATARIGKQTKITVAGNKSKREDLKEGMACEFDYFGDGGQARSISCK